MAKPARHLVKQMQIFQCIQTVYGTITKEMNNDKFAKHDQIVGLASLLIASIYSLLFFIAITNHLKYIYILYIDYMQVR